MGKPLIACALILLLIGGGSVGATHQLQGLNTRIRIFGIIQDEMAKGVTGGVIFVEHEYRGSWYLVDNCTDAAMTSHAWGCYVSAAGKYKVNWEKYGWAIVEERQTEFTLPDSPPKGDIVFVVKRVEPTATPEYTATPTLTVIPTLTPSPAPTSTPDARVKYGIISWFGTFEYRGTLVSDYSPYGDGFLQVPTAMQRRIIKAARTMQGEAKQPLDEMELDPLWLAAAEQGLGAQLTPGFEYRGYRVMGFSQGIVVIEKGD